MKIRRLLSMAIILLYLFTFAPTAFAENDESAATAYNVHITGVFITGQTLTAQYNYYHPYGMAENTDAVTYTWFAACHDSKGTTTVLQQSNSPEFVITSDAIGSSNWTYKDIFVAVQTSGVDDGGVLGAPVYSRIHSDAISTGYSKLAAAHSAYIMPTGPKTEVEAGDEVAAYFSFVGHSNIGEHKYEWATKSSLDGEATVVQAESTSNLYTVKEDDLGKWLVCTITPVSLRSQVNTYVNATATYHLDNILNTCDFDVKLAGSSAFKNTSQIEYDGVTYKYPTELLLSDGVTASYNSSFTGSHLITENSERAWIEYDLGEVRAFDGFYFNLRTSTTAPTGITFSYKKNESDEWINKTISNSAKALETVASLDTVAEARYFRISFTGGDALRIADFYPILTDADFVKIDTARSNLVLNGDLDNCRTDLTLPSAAYTTTWASSNTDVITNDGKVYPQVGVSNTVTMTATITIGSKSLTKDFEVTVPAVNSYVVNSANASLSAGATISALNITRYTASNEGFKVLVCLYNSNNKLETLKINDITPNEIEQNTSVDITLPNPLTLPSDVTGYKVKVMIWQDLTTLIPLANVFEIR